MTELSGFIHNAGNIACEKIPAAMKAATDKHDVAGMQWAVAARCRVFKIMAERGEISVIEDVIAPLAEIIRGSEHSERTAKIDGKGAEEAEAADGKLAMMILADELGI